MKRCNTYLFLALTVLAILLAGCNPEIHVHTFDRNWSSDETNHWHKATCEHSDEVADKATHAFGNSETIKEATCSEEGVSEQVCKVCGYIKKSNIEKKTHTLVISPTVSPTCTEPGFSGGIECSVCGEILTPANEIGSLGHDFSSSWTTDKSATCTEEGSRSRHCTRCDEKSEATSISATGHQSTPDHEVPATCIKSGLSEGSHCSVCNIVLVEQVSVPALGHDYDSTHVVPTCTTDGYTAYSCSRCSDSFVSGKMPALGHLMSAVDEKEPTCTEIGWSAYQYCSRCDYTTYSEKTPKGHSPIVDVEVKATCTEKGLSEGSHCSVCDEILKEQEEIPAKGHSFTSPVVTEATCTEKGFSTHTCNICYYYYVDTYVDAKGHTIVEDAQKAATCLETGLTAGTHCSVCNEVLVVQETIPALGHDLIDHDAKKPDCTENGWDEYQTCSRCDYTSYSEIPATGHIFASAFTVDREATCLQEGIKSKHCSICDAVTDETAIPAKGHWVLIDEAVAATCTTTGLTQGSHCGTCGEVLVDQVKTAALGHDHIPTVVSPTCEENGYTVHSCSRCSDTYTDTIVKKTGHKIVEDLAVATTCLSSGLTQGTHCIVCEKVLIAQNVVPALGHDYESHEAKAASCTGIGWDEYQTCSRCDYSSYSEIPALGHDYESHEAKAASCTGIGWNEYHTCSRCDFTSYSEIPALGHDYESHEAKTVTCTDIGWDKYQTCSRCDFTSYSEIPALGHDYINHEAKTETCTEVGWKTYNTCSRCDYSSYIEIPALGHDYVNHEAKAASCTDKGWNEYHTCLRCDYSSYSEVPALGHDLVRHPSKEPTCIDSGWNAYDSCNRCDYATIVLIPSLGHDIVLHEALMPTCTEKGHESYESCTRCDYSTYQDIEALGHSFDSKWTVTDDYHWHASTCGHSIASSYGEHNWDEGRRTCLPGASTVEVTYKCAVCNSSKIEVDVLKAVSGSYGYVSGYFLMENGTIRLDDGDFLKKGNSENDYFTSVAKIAVDPYFSSVNSSETIYDRIYIALEDGSVWTNVSDYGVTTNYRKLDIEGVKDIVADGGSAYFLTQDGTAYSFGEGYNLGYGGAYGDISIMDTPRQVMTDVKSVVVEGYTDIATTYFLKTDGSVWACGGSGYGQLGTRANYITDPVMLDITDVKEIVVSDCSVQFLKNDDTTWGMGYNSNCKLGFNRQNNECIPTKSMENIRKIFTGRSDTFFISTSGYVYGCGGNFYDELGIHIENPQTFSPPALIMTDVKEVFCDSGCSYFLLNDDSLMVCGYNKNGQLGIGVLGQISTPVNAIKNVKQVCIEHNGDRYMGKAYFILNDGTVLFAGGNDITATPKKLWN